MKLEAVTVCIDYGDFLAVTAPLNLALFDRFIVITTERDEETREVCRRLSLDCLLTRDHLRSTDAGAGGFSKGRIVERGLQHLSKDGWRVHMDADIVLPRDTRRLLRAADLDEGKIYGCDRFLVRGWEEWRRLLRTGWLHHGYQNHVQFPSGFPVGARWADIRVGWVPIGFFQLWHSNADFWKGTRIRRYPQDHNDACRTDTQHALQWDRRERELLPELIAAHLESETAANGVNWRGRKTRRFGPKWPAIDDFAVS